MVRIHAAPPSAKSLRVEPIAASAANRFIVRYHYSGKIVPNSQLHLGVFLDDELHGVMQYGPPINKKGTIRIVEGTAWNGFIELNRMAFDAVLPRNSESRAIAVSLRILRKRYPHLEWVVSFADTGQCGTGTIYRASGFVLTGIRKNEAIRRNPATGEPMHIIQAHHLKLSKQFRTWEVLPGYQLRYVYFLNPGARARLTVPVIPFNEIKALEVGDGQVH